ncbi:MAG: hypothetical protein M3154_04025 [Candidatus Eremiobacteraeota bacterium]|nr:hypothetical protein [Candidatus Eremiobacteraeota bacterium]
MKDDHLKPLIAGVNRSLPLRFRRKRLRWSAVLPETTLGINLSARFSGRYTIEVGAQPNDFVNPYYSFERDDISTYGFRQRADRLVSAGTDLTALDLDIAMDAAEREERVAEIFAQLVPHVLAWSTLDGLRDVAVHPTHQFSMRDALRRWLGAPPKVRSAGERAGFSERLVRFRVQAGLDLDAAAARTGITEQRLAEAEAGTGSLYDDEYTRVGEVYGLDPSMIFGGSGEVIVRQVTTG